MELLEERIRRDGVVKSEGVLKVDSFLNHQLDIDLFDAMGEEFKRLFADAPITKILTIEASGIGIAAWWRAISACRWCSQRRLRASTWTARCSRHASSRSRTVACTTSSCRRSS